MMLLFLVKLQNINLFGVDNTKGLLEIREIGIITVPFIEELNLD